MINFDYEITTHVFDEDRVDWEKINGWTDAAYATLSAFLGNSD